MIFNPIQTSMWPDIAQLELEGYQDIAPEDPETLKSRWLASPDTCFVYQEGEAILGFVLAHPWHSLTPPPLFKPLEGSVNGDLLFVHDLVVSRHAFGRGIGRLMAEHLLGLVQQRGFTAALLVSVQGSVEFWRKFGFEPIDKPISPSYGEGAVLMRKTLA